MEDKGTAIRDAFEFLQQAFSETSILLQMIEDAMAKAGLKCPNGSASVWDRSAAFYNPTGWMAPYVHRAYVDKEADGYEKGKVAVLTIQFAPSRWEYPILFFGVAKLRKKDPVWHSLRAHTFGEDSLAFAVDGSPDSWTTYPLESAEDPIAEIGYRVMPLVAVANATELENEVIKPLLELYEETETRHL